MPTSEDILKALSRLEDPDRHQDLVRLNRIRELHVDGGRVRFTLVLSLPARPWHDGLKAEVRRTVESLPGVSAVEMEVHLETPDDPRAAAAPKGAPAGIRRVVAVASGKGGVGKSTTAVNLAVCLARSGLRVGLLDADVYGPNIPMMFGVPEDRPAMNAQQQLIPFEGHGVKLMSIGFLVEPNKPVIWRGPMLHNLIRQFLGGVVWGELDLLLVDLPPGTGDAPLSLVQSTPLAGAVIVTTPQAVALSDVRRSVAMFEEVRVPVLGVIENMGALTCPHCSGSVELFPGHGAEILSQEFQIPVLARVPFDPRVADGGDRGIPISLSRPESDQAKAFEEAAGQALARLEALTDAAAASPVIQVS